MQPASDLRSGSYSLPTELDPRRQSQKRSGLANLAGPQIFTKRFAANPADLPADDASGVGLEVGEDVLEHVLLRALVRRQRIALQRKVF